MDLARQSGAFAFFWGHLFQYSVFLFFFARGAECFDTDKTAEAQSHSHTPAFSPVVPFTLRTRGLCLSSVRGLRLSRRRLGERRRRRTPVPRSSPGSSLATRGHHRESLLNLSSRAAVLEYHGFLPYAYHSSMDHSFQTSLVGTVFEYSEEGPQTSDLVVRFCKDVQKRSQDGYIDFGRYVSSRSFLTGSEPIDYIQKLHNGDLVRCETTFEKMGRTAQVNIICGNCSNKACKDEQGCICSISYHERMCRVIVELAIPCAKSGPRVFKGFTVGFYPRSSEIVYNGFTQLGFEQLHHGFSFQTEQIHVSMYLSAMSSLSGLLGKPVFKVNPMKGLEVKLAGSGFSGAMPTTLAPTVLNVDWRCEIARSSPYEVHVLIPVEGYDPIEFTLTKTCGYRQEKESDPMKGWAIFGIVSCIFIVLSSLLCCGGLIYKPRMEHLYGLDVLPGMATLSAFVDAVGRPRGYLPADNPSENHTSQASWERMPVTTEAVQRTNGSTYGSI